MLTEPFYIDTHAHLYLSDFDTDRDEIVNRAINSGIKKVLLPNIDSSSIEAMNNMAVRYSGICFPMIGLHPTSVKQNYLSELDVIEKELEKGNYIGVGEIGIDLYWDKSYLKEQITVFKRQLDLSLQYNLPVVIHARESFNEIIEILKDYDNKPLKGIFHAFTGNIELSEIVIESGFKIGIGGILTYKNSNLPEVVKAIDLKNIVLETDSPYLAPLPNRGKRNESSYILHIAEAIKRIKNISLVEIAGITTQNVIELFDLGYGR